MLRHILALAPSPAAHAFDTVFEVGVIAGVAVFAFVVFYALRVRAGLSGDNTAASSTSTTSNSASPGEPTRRA